MSDGISEMNKEENIYTHRDGSKYIRVPTSGPDACEGCYFTCGTNECTATDECTGHVYKLRSPLATASAALAAKGQPLVADSILTGAEQALEMAQDSVRTFDTGATRDTDEGKHDIEAFFSPLVTKRRAEYMHLHRKQPDGNLRDGDNWQKGIPYQQSLKSLCRHIEDIKLLSRGYYAREDIETAICAAMFNLESMLLTRLEEREKS
jgi:hypothetical protein